jgi:uncharacterized membrane protein
MRSFALSWQFWALLSAVFAALTAIFAKIGVENVNSDFATLIRTVVILVVLGFILAMTGQWQSPTSISGRTYVFLMLSGLATGFLDLLLSRSPDGRRSARCTNRQAERGVGGNGGGNLPG